MGLIGGMLGIGGGRPDPAAAKLQEINYVDRVNNASNLAQKDVMAQRQLLQALQQQGGLQNQSDVYNQLQGIAAGTGPNPAQAMLNQATGQNVANQAALMAGQRGASANAGLIARQAAMQGANTQQQAIGQGATMQAQQALNAINAAGGIANTQAGNQMAQTNAVAGSQQALQSNYMNAMNAINQAQVGSQGSINSANAGLGSAQMGMQGNAIGGLMNAAGAGISALTSGGGEKMGPAFAKGGSVGPQSHIGQHLAKMACGGQMKGGGLVDVMISPGEKIVPPQEVEKVAQGGKPQMKTVPGQAKVSGDSLKNDTVKAKLPAGTVIVKRSRANNNPEGFIREVLAKRGKRK